MKNKKAKINYFENGPEYLFIVLVILGALVGLITRNILINYVIMFLFGIIIGVQYFNNQYKRTFVLTIIAIAIFLGYTLASYKNDWRIHLILYIGGAMLGFYLKKYKWII
ncbi:MAG: hypothetical protein ACMXX8_00240 [Candidatus Woesearchaeota archaeon]